MPATIARERQAGVYGESVEQIAGLLTGWLETKRREGSIPASPESACSGFSRHDQYRVLERFLESLTGDPVA